MTTRRALIASSLAAATTASAGAVPESPRLSFRIVRKGSVIGSHVFNFVRDGSVLTVSIAADIKIGLGPVALFRYRHRATERWTGDTFLGIDAETNDDGTRYKVDVRREGTGLAVERTGGSHYIAPANAMAATHWNRRMLSGPLINNQTGDLLRPTITSLGFETLTLPSGTSVRAERLALRGDVELDTWYSSSLSWFGLRFTGKDGSEIRYERV